MIAGITAGGVVLLGAGATVGAVLKHKTVTQAAADAEEASQAKYLAPFQKAVTNADAEYVSAFKSGTPELATDASNKLAKAKQALAQVQSKVEDGTYANDETLASSVLGDAENSTDVVANGGVVGADVLTVIE